MIRFTRCEFSWQMKWLGGCDFFAVDWLGFEFLSVKSKA